MKLHDALSVLTALALVLGGGPGAARAYDVALGSDGSDGALNVTTDTVLPLPADGIFHYTSLTVAAGATLSFSYTGDFHPGVVLLATGDVVIDGTLDVSGGDAGSGFAGVAAPGGTPGARFDYPTRRSARQTMRASGGSYARLTGGRGGDGGVLNSPGSCSQPGGSGGGGGGSLQIVSNGTVRGSGTITVSGGARWNPTGTSCTQPYAATHGGDGAILVVTNHFDGSGLTFVGKSGGMDVQALDVVSMAAATSGTSGGTPLIRYESHVRPWRALPTIAITHINGTPVSSSAPILPAGVDVTVRVRAQGCSAGTLHVQLQRWILNHSAHATVSDSVSSPTGDDSIDLILAGGTDDTYVLHAAVGCTRP